MTHTGPTYSADPPSTVPEPDGSAAGGRSSEMVEEPDGGAATAVRAALRARARSVAARTRTALAKPAGAVQVARLAPTGELAWDDRTPPWPGEYVVVDGARLYVRRVPDPPVDQAVPFVREAVASVDQAVPSVDQAVPSVREAVPSVREAVPSVREAVPSVREAVPSVREAVPSDREPAVYVHGLAGSSTNWTDLGVLLGSRLDGVALDLPGFGRSGPAPRRDYSINAFADLVIAYLEQSGRGPVHLFGNSMGGAVSIRVAALRPDLVRTLTLISPAVPDLRVRRPGTDSGMLLLLLPGVGNLVQRRIDAVTPEERARGLIEVCFADPSRIPAHRMAEAVEAVREREHLPWGPDAFRRSLRGLVAFYVSSGRRSPWQLMARITVPTLVIWGDQDRLVDVGLAPRVARSIPGARLLVLPGVGHTAQLEDPVVAARAFLALREDAAALSVPA